MRWSITPLSSLILLTVIAIFPGKPKAQPFPHVATTDPLPPEEEQQKLHLPPGFEIQLVASEPKIKKPINIAFDAAGRLWLTESVEYPFPAPPGKTPRDAVKILSDFAPDGRARSIVTFADGLNIPIGVLPLGKGAIIYSIPNLYYMVDTDGDGRADQKTILLSTYGYNDTHGMTGEFMHGFDGWIYACHGFANTSKVKGRGTPTLTMTSGNTYRFKADGSTLEQHTFGQVNPFGLSFDPLGNLYSTDCHSRPIYQLLKGAYYPSFGRPHDGLGFGPEMINHDHDSTGLCGVSYYAAANFPQEFRDNIYIGNVVTNRINRNRLERHGSTYKAIAMPDFVKSDDQWFRPVDIKLGPDGALYVADFYNRIIGHYEVPLKHPGRDRERGRIWRIIYRGPDGKIQPMGPGDLTKAPVADLVKHLGHPNLTVRLFATHELVERGGQAGAAATGQLLVNGSPVQRAHALWVLQRRGELSDKALSLATADKDPLVRVHALRILAERQHLPGDLRSVSVARLHDGDAFVQRAAAEVLGSHPAADNVQPLINLRHAASAADTHLIHVVRMALRNQLRPAETWKDARIRQGDERHWRTLADVSLGVPTIEAADFLLDHARKWPEVFDRLGQIAHHVARHGREGAGRRMLELVKEKYQDLTSQATVFKGVQQGLQERGSQLSNNDRQWYGEVVDRLLAAKEHHHIQFGVEMAGALRLENTHKALAGVAMNRQSPEHLRRSAFMALAAMQPEKALVLLGGIIADTNESPGLREQAIQALASSNQAGGQAELTKALQAVPARLQTAIAIGLAGSPQGAEKLLAAVTDGKASARLLQEQAVAIRLQQTRIPQLAERLAKLTKGLPPPDQRLNELLRKHQRGFASAKADAKLGAAIFEKHCAICHQIGNRGAKIGPQLDGIGIRGLERLLEDVLDPNRNVDQAFRATTLTLKNGQLVTGLFLRQDGQVLVLADAQGKEVRVSADAVDERVVSQLSPMPANFAEQVPAADFHHLLAFLLGQRANKE